MMLLSAALIFMPEMEAKLSAVILFVLLDVSTLQAFPNNICVARRQILLASEVRQLNVIFFLSVLCSQSNFAEQRG